MQAIKNIFALTLLLCFCAFSQGVDEVDSLAPWIPRNLPDGMQFSGAPEYKGDKYDVVLGEVTLRVRGT